LQLSVFAGGFIMTSLIWAAATAKIVDRRYYTASIYFALGGMLVLFGIMHSPLAGDKMFLPWDLTDTEIFSADSKRIVLQFAIAYLVMAVLMFIMGNLIGGKTIDSDEEFEKLAE
jgi:AGZA family xanthine/uracil permease-like MFS transporter